MLLSILGALALTITSSLASSDTSPLFFLSSTAHLSTTSNEDLSNGPVSAVHHQLWSALSSCPTKHYAVIIQPGVKPADYDTVWLPIGAGVRTALIANTIHGKADVTAVVNTILMDCLHHGITRAETLNTSELAVPELDRKTIDESIIYAVLPEIDGYSQKQRDVAMDENDRFVENFIGKYWNNKDYTLIYITEAQNEEDSGRKLEELEHGLGAEVPFVFDEED